MSDAGTALPSQLQWLLVGQGQNGDVHALYRLQLMPRSTAAGKTQWMSAGADGGCRGGHPSAEAREPWSCNEPDRDHVSPKCDLAAAGNCRVRVGSRVRICLGLESDGYQLPCGVRTGTGTTARGLGSASHFCANSHDVCVRDDAGVEVLHPDDIGVLRVLVRRLETGHRSGITLHVGFMHSSWSYWLVIPTQAETSLMMILHDCARAGHLDGASSNVEQQTKTLRTVSEHAGLSAGTNTWRCGLSAHIAAVPQAIVHSYMFYVCIKPWQ